MARISGGIGLAIFASLGAVGVLVGAVRFGARGLLIAGGGWAAFVLAWGALVLFWPGVRHRYTRYTVSPDGIEIRRGVLWRSVITVPRNRVQHTDVSRGPLERGFGIATLVIHTAGTEQAAVGLSGLPEAAAFAIRDFLIEGGEGDAV